MKKIIILMLAGLFISTTVLAETPGYTGSAEDYEFDIEYYTDTESGEIDYDSLTSDIDTYEVETEELIPVILTGDVVEHIDFSEIIPDLSEEDKATITTTLEDEGYDAETIASTINVVERLSVGDTISDIRDDDPDTFNTVENAIISAVATQAIDSVMTDEMRDEMEESLDLVGNMIGVLDGFAQSTANSSVSSSLFGYQDYKYFAATIGILGSFAVPEPYATTNTILSLGDDEEIVDELQDMGIEAGVTVQGFSAAVGINMSWLVDKLYLGVVFGSTGATISTTDGLSASLLGLTLYDTSVDDMPVEIPEEIESIDLTLGSSIFGLKANYQIFDGFGIPFLFRWNGLSLGSGFIFNSMNISAEMDLSSTLELPDNSLGAEFSIVSNTFTIPLEASTGIQLLSALTITTGAAVDLQFGSSDVSFDLTTSNEDGIGPKVIRETINELLKDSTISFPYSSEGGVAFFNPRVNLGVGIGIGPAIFDVSAFYYFRTGVALGANFVIRI